MEDEQRSDKHETVRNTLPDELKPVFDQLVGDYKFVAAKLHGWPAVSYAVLAELDRLGVVE